MKYFDISEFDSPDAPGSGAAMDAHFLKMLDAIRAEAGIPFNINSGYRTATHNAKVGGKPSSAHLRGYAADVSAPSGYEKYLIIEAALAHKVRRIGISSTFIHLDIDSTLPGPTIFLY